MRGSNTCGRSRPRCGAQGIDFLGRRTTRGPVAYCSLEDARRAVGEHFRQLGVWQEDALDVHTGAAPLDAIKGLRGEIERLRPVLVVVDTVFRLTRVRD